MIPSWHLTGRQIPLPPGPAPLLLTAPSPSVWAGKGVPDHPSPLVPEHLTSALLSGSQPLAAILVLETTHKAEVTGPNPWGSRSKVRCLAIPEARLGLHFTFGPWGTKGPISSMAGLLLCSALEVCKDSFLDHFAAGLVPLSLSHTPSGLHYPQEVPKTMTGGNCPGLL